jgi:primosomal protein N'
MDTTPTIIAVKFKGGDKTYDFFATIPVLVGQRVWVPMRNGGKTKAMVVQIKAESDNAEHTILGVVEEPFVPQEPAQ